MDRRRFLFLTSVGVAAVSLPTLRAAATDGIPAVPILAEGAGLTGPQWRTLAAVQDHLFPTEAGAPGAREINAALYLKFVLSDPRLDPADGAMIRRGVDRVDRIALELQGAGFPTLSVADREAVLRRMEQTEGGEQWLHAILDYILEALLTDPVYGGNPGAIGWKWLDHWQAAPHPPPEKRYFLL
ncbi:MAG: gluconate 2-dehydrogenase subunit 3 family protein [Pseudomonadota bacterium]|nr:gluconate 2-dehydrogenase subunit 3 family protein [Pseudomonadota bacterium]